MRTSTNAVASPNAPTKVIGANSSFRLAEGLVEPFVGPRPFEASDDDAVRFFGRQAEAHDLKSLIIANSELLVYAPSGAGKTSLLNARVIPELMKQDVEVLPPVRVGAPRQPSAEAASNIYVYNMMMWWAEEDRSHPVVEGDPSSLTIAEALAAWRARSSWVQRERPLRARVVVFDQFEELFVRYPERWRDRRGFFEQVRDALVGTLLFRPGDLDDSMAARLLERLRNGDDPVSGRLRTLPGARSLLEEDPEDGAAETLRPILNRLVQGSSVYDEGAFSGVTLSDDVRDMVKQNPVSRNVMRLNRLLLEAAFPQEVPRSVEGDPLLRVVFSMRQDYIAELDPYVAILPDRLRTRFHLDRLREGAALQAVVGPVSRTRRRFADGVAEALVKDLLERTYKNSSGDVLTAPGEFVEPVQLQVVCQRLWSRLNRDEMVITAERLKSSPNVDESLREFYEECVAKAVAGTEVSERALRRWFGEELITPAGTRGTLFWNEQAKTCGSMPTNVVEEIQKLYLVRDERRSNGRWFELAHDRFVRPILESNAAWKAAQASRPVDQRAQWLEARAAEWRQNKSRTEYLLGRADTEVAQRFVHQAKSEGVEFSNDVRDLIEASAAQVRAEEQRLRAEEARARADHALAARKRLLLYIGCLCVAVLALFFLWREADAAKNAARAGRDADTASRRASDLYRANEMSGALSWYKDALNKYERTNDAAGKAAALTSMAEIDFRHGRYDAAQKGFSRAMKLWLEAGSGFDAERSACLNLFADHYYEQGRFEDALPLYDQALKIERDAGLYGFPTASAAGTGSDGPGDKDFQEGLARKVAGRGVTAISLGNLATCQLNQKRPQYEVGSLSQQSKVLRDALDSLGRYTAAEPLFDQALQVCFRVYGARDPQTARALLDLGKLYAKQGKYQRAEMLLTRGWEVLASAAPGNGPEAEQRKTLRRLEAAETLAGLYLSQGRLEDAERLYKASLEERQRLPLPAEGAALPKPIVASGPFLDGTDSLPPDFANARGVAECRRGLASCFRTQGRLAAAIAEYQLAMQRSEPQAGGRDPNYAMSIIGLANALRDAGRGDEAEQKYDEAITILERERGTSHPDTAHAYNNKGMLLGRRGGRFAKAEELFKAALDNRVAALGPGHPSVAYSYYGLAIACRVDQQFKRAEPLFQRAMEIRIKTLGSDHPDLALTYAELAILYHEQNRLDMAEALFERALAIHRNERRTHRERLDVAQRLATHGGDSSPRERVDMNAANYYPDAIPTFKNYAKLVRARGNAGQAEKLETIARSIESQEQPSDSPPAERDSTPAGRSQGARGRSGRGRRPH
jgi:tetratricopeptide (TPR) repeat protein